MVEGEKQLLQVVLWLLFTYPHIPKEQINTFFLRFIISKRKDINNTISENSMLDFKKKTFVGKLGNKFVELFITHSLKLSRARFTSHDLSEI